MTNRNSIEIRTKEVISQKHKPEITVELIGKFANFKKEAILKALKKGGKDVSEIYMNIVRFDKMEVVIWT